MDVPRHDGAAPELSRRRRLLVLTTPRVIPTCRLVEAMADATPAWLGAISGGAFSGAIGAGFAAATHSAWWACLGLGVLILVLGLLTTTASAERTARDTAERLRDGGPRRAPSGYSPRELAPS